MYKILANTEFMGKKVHYLPSCQSTNTVAADLVLKDEVPNGTLVITDEQTKGVGQLGNKWESEAGNNLTFTIILYPQNHKARNQFELTKVTALGITDYLRQFLSIEAKIKWPNDIVYQENKVAGILINNSIRDNMLVDTIIGIGLNVNQTSFQSKKATSLARIMGRELNLQILLEGIVSSIESRYLTLLGGQGKRLNTEYLLRLLGINEVTEFYIPGRNEHTKGIVRGIDDTGLLRVEFAGKMEKFGFKEIVFENFKD